MKKQVSIGIQGFEKLRNGGYFYVDKTDFIRKWWESGDDVTLITRPRRFGKTLNVDMLNCFFSNRYEHRGDLFEGLSIWKNEKYRKLQGSYPVIFLSFADVKETTYEGAVQKIKNIITDLYIQYNFLKKEFSETELMRYQRISYDMDVITTQDALKNLSAILSSHYGKNVILLLDEYDTPMQEAYVSGYWEEFTSFIRSLFNATFKTNPYLERAMMTGITRVSKESIFSDLNNLRVITTTSDSYATCFGFTENEVFQALTDFGMSENKQEVKQWYDGFIFGSHSDIYNPWSITNYLSEKKLRAYWAFTSSNHLVDKLIRAASPMVKEQMEDLMQGTEIAVTFDEQIIFNQLEQTENAIWSLLMASGYLKPETVEYRGELLEPWYHLKMTNLETKAMFTQMFKGWFSETAASYGAFLKAMLQGDLESMNYFMNNLCQTTFSYFDVGQEEPKKFYHGFVLGLMAEQSENYTLKSNRESGFGRYDVMMIPKKKHLPAIVMEFKAKSRMRAETLEEALQAALNQIEEKNYDAELVAMGFSRENIRHYGFAFEGKKVLIG